MLPLPTRPLPLAPGPRYGDPREAAVWTLIVILTTALFGMFFYLGSRIDQLGTKLDGRIDHLGGRIDQLTEQVAKLAEQAHGHA